MLRWAMRDAVAWRASVNAGKPIEALEPPDLLPGFDVWYEDFFELSTDRQLGMGVGPIPKASIDAHVAGWPDDEARMFRACIRRMDDLYLDLSSKPASEAPPPELAGSSNPARDAFRGAARR